VIALRLIAWFWFTYAIIFTLKHYPEKSGFYYPLYTIYSVWYVSWSGQHEVLSFIA